MEQDAWTGADSYETCNRRCHGERSAAISYVGLFQGNSFVAPIDSIGTPHNDTRFWCTSYQKAVSSPNVSRPFLKIEAPIAPPIAPTMA